MQLKLAVWPFALALAAASPAHAGPEPAPAKPGVARDGQSDFDFILGAWRIKNRVLRKQPSGEDTWYEFDSTSTNRPIWDGAGNIEEWDGVGPNGRIQGVAVRLYDPAARHWTIYWGDRRQGILFQPPIVGSFTGNRGEFYADSTQDGRPLRERVIWTRLTKDTCRWEQAASLDGGKTWKTNWVMDFTRLAK